MSVKFVSPLGLPVASSDQANNLGQIYFNSTTKKIRVYKNSGWSDLGGSSSGSSGKSGMVTNWAGSYTNVPTGWLLCNGDAVSRTTYADLFAVIGTKFGSGDGSSTFNVPDYQLYWLMGPSNALGSVAPNPSGDPSNWVVTTGTAFYASFDHSTSGAHSSHAASLTSSGGHSHTGTHSHTATSGTSGSATEGSHTVDGGFNFAGAAHTHSVTSGTPSVSISGAVGGSTGSSSTHTHVVSLASAASSSNHVATTTSYTGTASHAAHTHAAGSATTSDSSGSPSANANHTHTLSSPSSSGGHAHATHDPKRQTMYYIIKT